MYGGKVFIIFHLEWWKNNVLVIQIKRVGLGLITYKGNVVVSLSCKVFPMRGNDPGTLL
jgi:hypothetical protein